MDEVQKLSSSEYSLFTYCAIILLKLVIRAPLLFCPIFELDENNIKTNLKEIWSGLDSSGSREGARAGFREQGKESSSPVEGG
jgi:hypothetical protein